MLLDAAGYVAGMANILAALSQHAPAVAAAKAVSSSSILPMTTAEELQAWERLDDVIMVSSKLYTQLGM